MINAINCRQSVENGQLQVSFECNGGSEMLFLQLLEGAVKCEATFLQNQQAVRNLLDFLKIMAGNHDGFTFLAQLLDVVPKCFTRVCVHPDSRFIEEE